MGLAVLHEKRREVGVLLCSLCAVSHYLNWGPLSWMSHWLDEQYVTMSLAALLAVVGVWWVFTRNASDAVAPEEPAPVILGGAAAIVMPMPQQPSAKKKKKNR